MSTSLAPNTNPFGQPQANPLFNAPTSATQNPFGASPNPLGGAAQNPLAAAAPNPIATQNQFKQSSPSIPNSLPTPAANPFRAPQQITANAFLAPAQSVFGKNSSAPKSVFGGAQGQFGGPQPSSTQPNKQDANVAKKSQVDQWPKAKGVSGKIGPTRKPTERTKELSEFAYNYSNRLIEHLWKENIKPPQWPADLGNPNKRGAVENLKAAYKKYRARVYESLRKADLIDDPEKRRRLEDALPFKGTCEDMCPEFEQISRIAEHDVVTQEKEEQPNSRDRWAQPSLMVKKFGRSAAGQEAPLPMDVRSVAALRRTIDYLFNDLLQSDANLPAMHNFLWDRTRGVRRDFTFHSQKSPEEMKELVYCFETITRFHATALHLLSRKGFANEGFEPKQEIEQLGRTILSLIEAYDECREQRVVCENEPEFRAYYVLLNAHDPSIGKRVAQWGKKYWFESEEIQIAMSLIQAMEDVREGKGPIKPRRMTTLANTAFTNYFAIVEDPRVSYTMACIAEVHFTSVRQTILKNLVRANARYRDAPRTITAADLNQMLRFDTDEEAVAFAELHQLEFTTWVPEGKPPVTEPYLLLNNKKKFIPSPRVEQSYSGKVVERKRTSQSLPYVIYNTIYEETSYKSQDQDGESSPDELFVRQTKTPNRSPSLLPTEIKEPQPSPSTTSKDVSNGDASSRTTAVEKPLEMPIETPVERSIEKTAETPGQTQAPKPSVFGSTTSQSPAPGSQTSQTPVFGSAFQSAMGNQTSPISILNQTPAPSIAQASIFKTADTTSPKSGFSSNQTSQPAQPATEIPAASLATPKPSGPASPFSFLNNASTSVPPTAPSDASTKLGPSSSSPSASDGQPTPSGGFPSLFDRAPKPSTGGASILSQVVTPEPPSIVVTPALSYKSVVKEPIQGLRPTTQTETTTKSPFAFPSPAGPPAPIGGSNSLFPQTPLPQPEKPVKQPSREPDLMDKFTNWFVKGDGGLMEEFTEATVTKIVEDTFKQFQEDEEARKKKEEDDESWRQARAHQNWNLRVKFFYRWQKNARALATKRILRAGKEKMRAYWEAERIRKQEEKAVKERAEKDARKAAKRQLQEYGDQFGAMASQRRSSVEAQLLASGIFAGLRNEREAARQAAMGDFNGHGRSTYSLPESDGEESELELEPPRPSNATRQRLADSPDDSTVGKREGWKTRSLREKFGLDSKRSVSGGMSVDSSFNGSSRFRQSVPVSGRVTNFPRKRRPDNESTDGERDAKRKSGGKPDGFKSMHWEMRARGFVSMPNGQWLPEALARSARDDNRSASTSVGPEHKPLPDPMVYNSEFEIDDEDDEARASLRARLDKLRMPNSQNRTTGRHQHTPSVGDSRPNTGYLSSDRSHSFSSSPRADGAKRKRHKDDDTERYSSPSAKKPNIGKAETNAMVERTQEMLRELRETMDRLDSDRPFLQENILRGTA
ncbi:SAC3/GANP/Nin1/mts3/eIF-3 p25 family-domain-containing protein [Podospora didyma]|uniref:SAC3/GANP/Nin1/mts3/eIF-3 p25 family-domain-containing protein n=1 Tax=Podospora didyma TaxID=330526 RepID=A0AAE0KKB7_9PEZI|nr:SAC3/GANP/Nin1/mts3/eIF-3 p25 family-domain-containing protein [Podospora didyma]